MPKKLIYIAALAFPIAVLAVWSGMLEISRHRQPQVLISVEGYDPRSLLSGHYLNLRLNWEQTDCRQFPQNICPQERFKSRYVYYLPEKRARELEKILSRRQNNPQLNFSFPSTGTPQILDLYLDGKSWTQYSAEQDN